MKKFAVAALTAVMATSILTVPAKASTDENQGFLPGGCVVTNGYCDMEPRNEGFVPYFYRTCRPGDVDGGVVTRDVQHLQCSLVGIGYRDLDAVGVFGPKTQEAVEEIQEKYGLEVNGIVDPATWKVIMDVASK